MNLDEIHEGDVLVWHAVPARVVCVKGDDVVIDVPAPMGNLYRLVVDPANLQPDRQRRFVDHPLHTLRSWRCLVTVPASPTHQAGQFELLVTAASAAEARQIAVLTLVNQGHDPLWVIARLQQEERGDDT